MSVEVYAFFPDALLRNRDEYSHLNTHVQVWYLDEQRYVKKLDRTRMARVSHVQWVMAQQLVKYLSRNVLIVDCAFGVLPASSHPERVLSVLRQFDTHTLINVSSSAAHIAHYLNTGQLKPVAHDAVHSRGRAAMASLSKQSVDGSSFGNTAEWHVVRIAWERNCVPQPMPPLCSQSMLDRLMSPFVKKRDMDGGQQGHQAARTKH